MRRVIVLFIASSFAFAGCGDEESQTYTLDASTACFRDAGFEVSTEVDDLDLIAQNFEGRAAQLDVRGTEAQVIFADDAKQADGLKGQYSLFTGTGLGETFTKGNVAVGVSGKLPEASRETLENCLA